MLPEEKARVKIDKQLNNAGWDIVDRKDYLPNYAMAVKEALMQGGKESDYLLFVDNKAIAVVEANVLFFEKGKPTEDIWVYDYRTGIKHTLVQKPLTRENLDDFVDCYCSGHMQDRVPTYSVDNPNGRWRKFSKEEVYARDQLKLDFKWIVSEEDDDRTLAEMIAQIKEEATSIASAVAELEKLIGEVEE